VLTEADLRRVTEAALAYSKADQTEVLLFDTDSALTRFANNEIHQNVAERDTTLLVRVVYGKKIGVASINRADEAGVRLAIERANDLARFQVENQDFHSLPSPRPAPQASGYSEATANFTPEDRARTVSVVLRRGDVR
jgi:predicted Zn-dependent protease